MKTLALTVLTTVMCAACSGEDVQVSLEKVEATKAAEAEQKTTVAPEVQPPAAPVVASAVVPKTEFKSIKQTSSGSSLRSGTTDLAKTEIEKSQPVTEEPAAKPVVIEKVATTIKNEATDLQADRLAMAEANQSLAAVNDAEIIGRYSGVSTAIPLQKGWVALQVANRGLVSNVKSVEGATAIVADPSGFGFTVALSGDYLFEFDKDSLTEKAREALVSVLTLYKDYGGTEIAIAGHTDSKGSNDYNLDLSKRRAASVKNWFEQQGVAGSLLTTTGHGESQPVAPNSKNGKDFPEGRALNRRVDITVKTSKKVNHLPTASGKSAI